MALNRKQRAGRHAYAVVRVDIFQDETVAWSNRITVKSIEWTEQMAEQEVRRLNGLNAEKQCLYFWQVTRLASPVESAPD
jgi:hypothetical protein